MKIFTIVMEISNSFTSSYRSPYHVVGFLLSCYAVNIHNSTLNTDFMYFPTQVSFLSGIRMTE